MRNAWLLPLAVGMLLTAGCEDSSANETASEANVSVHLQNLSDLERRRFLDGLREFSEMDSPAEGLGPFFNAASCAHCHSLGGIGGGGNVRVVRAMCRDSAGQLQEPAGGSLIHLFSTRPDIAAPHLPRDCDLVVTQRRTTNVLGLGLIEAIPDSEIVAEAARQSGSTAGKVAWIKDIVSGRMRVGRFGWKNQHADLTAFAADAYLNEMGVTNEFFPHEVAPQGDQALLTAADTTPDPEAAVGAVQRSADFMRFSAPPTARDTPPADGFVLFEELGCADCHRERYQTGPGTDSMAQRDVVLYSDLLLHDIGTGGDIPQAAAGEREFRTAPLIGVSQLGLLLHDGRAWSLEDAIALHQGQARNANDAYQAASADERSRLLQFLRSL